MTSPAQIERQPHGSGWARIPVPESVKAVAAISSAWTFGKITGISSLVYADLPDGAGVDPQWFISVTRSGGRPTASDVRKAQRSFRMVGTEEDNHHPGHARHFWLPCDPAHRVACQCKTDEATIKDVAARALKFSGMEKEGDKWIGGCYATTLAQSSHPQDVNALIDYIKPDKVHILSAGRIVKSGGPELAVELEKSGYESVVGAG